MIGLFGRAISIRCVNASFLVVAAVAAAAARGDVVELVGKPAFEGVEVVGFRGGKLAFRGVSGETLRKPLGQVARIGMTRLPDFTAAEQDRAAADTLKRYEAAVANAREPWLRLLVRCRMLHARERSGDFLGAVREFIGLVREGALSDSAAAPRRPDAPGSAANARARQMLEAAAAQIESPELQAVLHRLVVELHLFDGIPPPAAFGPPESDGNPTATAPARSAAPRRLFGGPAARAIHPVRLTSDSFVLEAAASALAAGDAGRALQLWESALPYLDAEARWEVRLQIACARLEAGEPARAADALAALTGSEPPASIAAAALYHLGLAEARMERPERAALHWREAAAHPGASAELAAQVRAALQCAGAREPATSSAPAEREP